MRKESHSHNTENKFSTSCFNSTEIQTGVASYAHSIGYIHYQVKIGSSWLQHARVNRLRQTALLLHFDEEESGSQASQGNRQQTWLECSSGIMHLKTLSSSAQGIKSLPHVPLEGWRGINVRYHRPGNDRRQCPVVFWQVYTINCHLQFCIWLHPL